MTNDDINERLGYDADIDDPGQYCSHGTFIGSWWGPDYLCYYCETGEEPPTQFQVDFQAFARRLKAALDDLSCYDRIVTHLQTLPYQALFADALTESVINHNWEKAEWLFLRRQVFQ